MSQYKQTESIVLNSEDVSEQDKGFTIYTKDYGKLFVIAKGGKKIQSKLSPHMQPFSISDIRLVQGRYTHRLIESHLIHDFEFIKKHLAEIALGSYCLEIVDALISEQEQDEAVYFLLKELLEVLNEQSFHDESDKKRQVKELLLTKIFALKLLKILGYEPYLDECVECASSIRPDMIFFDTQRGVVCEACGTKNQQYLRMSSNALKTLRLGFKISLKELMNIAFPKALVVEINHIAEQYIKQYIETDIKSEVWLSGLLK